MNPTTLEYFATLPTDQIGGELIKLRDKYYEHLEKTGHFTLLKAAHQTYYKAAVIGGRLRQTGENLEYTEISVNHYRNLLQHSIALVSSQRPQFEPKAANTDYKSMCQTQLAVGLLDYYMRTKKMERYIKTAVELALNLGEAFVYCGWNATGGDQYGSTEDGAPIFEGDIEFKNFSSLDTIRDVTKPEGDNDWVIFRDFKNKFDLAAKYPELRDRILSVSSESYQDLRFTFRELREAHKFDIPVYIFFHRKSDAVPHGRYLEMVDSDIILNDGPLPYRTIPCYSLVAGKKEGSIFGYTNFWDILPIQQAYDKLASIVVTNQATFGVQNVMVPKGNDLNVTQLTGGLNLIEFDPKAGPPAPLQLTATPPEVFTALGLFRSEMETISGVNATARGNPESSLKSGNALALVQSMAIQFSQSLQQSYAILLEDLGTAVIDLLRDFATVPRVALIAGKASRSQMREFKGDDLNKIQRVMVDMGNPLMRLTSGRIQVADSLLQNNLIQTPQQYLQVLASGRLEPMYEAEIAQLNLIRAENEALAEGREAPVLRTDLHELHIQEHHTVLSSPETRLDPALLEKVLMHIDAHEQILAMRRQQAPLPATPTNVGQVLNPTNPVVEKAQEIEEPSLPQNPMTGETVNG